MDSQGSFNFQDLFNQSTVDVNSTEFTITGLQPGVIGVDSSGRLTDQVSTDELVEGGTNFYYTDARARKAFSGINPIVYNDNTGEISFNGSGFTFTNINAVSISAGTGVFDVVRTDVLAGKTVNDIRLKGLSTNVSLVQIPDGYTNPPFPSLVNEKDLSIGWQSGNQTTVDEKNRNVNIGNRAGRALTGSSTDCINIGQEAGFSSTGPYSINIGSYAGYLNKQGRNINIGHNAGYTNQDGTGNINIGFEAGQDNLSNRLQISNRNTPNPLVLGEFDNNRLIINDTIQAKTGAFDTLNCGTGYISNIGFDNLTGPTGSFQGIKVNNILPISSPFGMVNMRDSSNNLIAQFGNGGMTCSTGVFTSLQSTNRIFLPATGSFFNNYVNWNAETDGVNMLSMNRTNATETSVGVGYRSKRWDPTATSGQRNCCMGWRSLESNTTGTENVAFGHNSGVSISSGFQNLAFGSSTFNFLGTANQNNAFGMSAGYAQISGFGSNYFGVAAGRNANNSYTVLQENSIFGHQSFQPTSNIQAQNTMVGAQITSVSGSNNTFLGYATGSGLGVGNNRLVINTRASSSIDRAMIEGVTTSTVRQLRLNCNSIQVGYETGLNNQASNAIAIGYQAGLFNQGTNAIAIGYQASLTGQRADAISIGDLAGLTNQATGAIAIGNQAGADRQGLNSIAIGNLASNTLQGANSIAIGHMSGQNQGPNSICIGNSGNNQGTGCIVIGHQAGANQQSFAVAIGYQASSNNQGQSAISIGNQAGYYDQGNNSVAIGYFSGQTQQGVSAVAIGVQAGRNTQGQSSVAIGDNCAVGSQGQNSVAIGPYSAWTGQGTSCVAIGYLAGYNAQVGKSIAINASAEQLNPTNEGFYVRPVRQDDSTALNPLVYTTNKEIVQSNTIKASITGPSGHFFDLESGNMIRFVDATGTKINIAGTMTAGAFTGPTGSFDNVLAATGTFTTVKGTVMTGATGYFGVVQTNGIDVVSRFYVKSQASGDYRVCGSFYRTTTGTGDTLIRCHSDWGATNREVMRVNSNGDLLNWNSSYGAISDQRLKTDIQDCHSQIQDIKNIKVRRYKLLNDTEYQIGVIAQELLETSPNLVSQPCEGFDFYSVKYSVLYTKALKALQELIEKVEILENKINSMNI